MSEKDKVVEDTETLLRLIKVAFCERGVPYHFCKADYERNKIGLQMNEKCRMLCVGPHRDGKQHAIVTCGSNQRLRGFSVWGTRSNSRRVAVPSKDEREVLLNEAFNYIQLGDCGGVHHKIPTKSYQLPVLRLSKQSEYHRPRFAVGENVKCLYMGQWINGKVIAHYPEEWVRKNCDAMPVVPYLVRENQCARRLMYVLNDNDDVIIKRHLPGLVESSKSAPRLLLPKIQNEAINTINPTTEVFGAPKQVELPVLIHGVYVWTDRPFSERSEPRILARKYGKFSQCI